MKAGDVAQNRGVEAVDHFFSGHEREADALEQLDDVLLSLGVVVVQPFERGKEHRHLAVEIKEKNRKRKRVL